MPPFSTPAAVSTQKKPGREGRLAESFIKKIRHPIDPPILLQKKEREKFQPHPKQAYGPLLPHRSSKVGQ